MLRLTVLLVILVAALECSAQQVPEQGDSTTLWRIETNDDNEFIGRVIEIKNGVMTLATEKFGTLRIRMVDVKLIEEADPDKMIGEEYWAENFQSTRYLWMPNGYGLKAGEAYYQNVWIFFNQFSVGVTNNFSLSAGVIPIFLLGSEVTPVWLNAKVSVPLGKKVHFGGGVLYLTALNFSDDVDIDGAGVAYGVLTLGSRDHNVSFGAGYGFSRGDFSQRPVITISGTTRLGRRSYLLTENYIFGVGDGRNSESFGLVSIGGRRLIKRMGLDFGGFIPVSGGMNRLLIIPWLGFSAPIGKQHLPD